MKNIRERMRELDFKESFIGKVLKTYPLEKIEEKLALLTEQKNIQNPAAWLISALKCDYQGIEWGNRKEESPSRLKRNSHFGGDEKNKFLPREEAIKRIQKLKKELMAINSR